MGTAANPSSSDPAGMCTIPALTDWVTGSRLPLWAGVYAHTRPFVEAARKRGFWLC